MIRDNHMVVVFEHFRNFGVMVAQIPGRANERLHHTGHLLSGILYHKMTTDARLMILVRACGAPNPAKNEYGKLELTELIVTVF